MQRGCGGGIPRRGLRRGRWCLLRKRRRWVVGRVPLLLLLLLLLLRGW